MEQTMNKVQVRCWQVENFGSPSGPDSLYIAYPEDNSGHDLITCLKCGAIYAVTVVKEIYIGPPLAEKLKGLICLQCSNPLEENYAYYPETYVVNGKMYSFLKPQEIPSDDKSMVKEFAGIYE